MRTIWRAETERKTCGASHLCKIRIKRGHTHSSCLDGGVCGGQLGLRQVPFHAPQVLRICVLCPQRSQLPLRAADNPLEQRFIRADTCTTRQEEDAKRQTDASSVAQASLWCRREDHVPPNLLQNGASLNALHRHLQRTKGTALVFSLMHRSHSISFTRAQGIPKYNIGFGREKDGRVLRAGCMEKGCGYAHVQRHPHPHTLHIAS
jgi:hypothetical protein